MKDAFEKARSRAGIIVPPGRMAKSVDDLRNQIKHDLRPLFKSTTPRKDGFFMGSILYLYRGWIRKLLDVYDPLYQDLFIFEEYEKISSLDPWTYNTLVSAWSEILEFHYYTVRNLKKSGK